MKRIIKFMIITIVIIISCILLYHISSWKTASSIGIIGGADGPTRIFLSDYSVNNLLLYVGAGILILAFIIVLVVIKKKK